MHLRLEDGSDVCVILVLILIAVEVLLTFHIVGWIKVDESLAGEVGDDGFEKGSREVCCSTLLHAP